MKAHWWTLDNKIVSFHCIQKKKKEENLNSQMHVSSTLLGLSTM